MTTTDNRQGRTAFDLLSFLPLALLIVMFGVAVLIAQVAPSRVTSGVYQVIVGEGATQFTLATESLTCNRTGNTATCTALVAGQQLTVEVDYHDPGLSVGSTCMAWHGDRPVSCLPEFGYYGHASVSVRIPDQLGVTEPELSRLRDAVPWWRTGNDPSIAMLALPCVLAAITGAAAYLLSKRTRPQAATWRFPIAAGTGFLGLALLATSNLVITPSMSNDGLYMVMFSPTGVTPGAALAAWQYQLGGTGGHSRAQRWTYAISAAIATAFYTAVSMFIFLLHSGFID